MIALNPALTPACLAPLQRIVRSAWTQHTPFLRHWLEISRPATFVELGTHHGMSYFAACQTIEALGLPTRAHAVDAWTGDVHMGTYGEEIYEDLRRYHSRYEAFSRLHRATFDEAASTFADGSIDLLHIDGTHTYEGVANDFKTWFPKLSARGVVLFHDTHVLDQATFGVWKLWQEVKSCYPWFEFEHGYGLGVLGVGGDLPAAVQALFQASPEQKLAYQQFFARLGWLVDREVSTPDVVEVVRHVYLPRPKRRWTQRIRDEITRPFRKVWQAAAHHLPAST